MQPWFKSLLCLDRVTVLLHCQLLLRPTASVTAGCGRDLSYGVGTYDCLVELKTDTGIGDDLCMQLTGVSECQQHHRR